MEKAEAKAVKLCVSAALERQRSRLAASLEIPVIIIPEIQNSEQYNLLIGEIFDTLLSIQNYYQILDDPSTTTDQFSETLKLISEHLLIVSATMQAVYNFENGNPEEYAQWTGYFRNLCLSISKIIEVNEAYADDNSDNAPFLGKLAAFITELDGLAKNNNEISNGIKKFGKNGTDPSVEHIADWVIANCEIVDESDLSDPVKEWDRKLCAKKYFESDPNSKFHEALDESSKIVVKKAVGYGTGLVGGSIGAIFKDCGILISEGISQGVTAGIDMIFDIFVIEDTGEIGLFVGKVGNGEEVELPAGSHDIIYGFENDQERAIVREVPVTKDSSTTVNVSSGDVGAYVPVSITGKIPDTGQTTSYTDTFGEDSDYTINPQSYTKLNANGIALDDSATEWTMVQDNVTGLMWEVKTDDGGIHDKDDTYNGQEAQDNFIAQLNNENFGGHSDWRLPTVLELSMLLNTGKNWSSGPTINTEFFQNTIPHYYLAFTPSAVDPEVLSWIVYFGGGSVYVGYKHNDYYVRAVRGGSETFQELVDNGDGTVADIKTGLMWQQADAGTMTWTDALNYCENLQLANNNDWRLPNRNELQSLVDYSKLDPAINTVKFPDTNSYYWSSTTMVDNNLQNHAWSVNFAWGHLYSGVYFVDKSTGNYVRAVRNIQ